MYNVLVTCSAGMSTSMLVQKVAKTAAEQGIDLTIEAVSMNEGKIRVKKHDYDLLLLGPQVAFMKEELSKAAGDRFPVKIINQKDYGMMRADNVLQDIIQSIEGQK
ncbi:PTS sugar transporter subunit IIB [Virgibacillus halophilus]|uniref:PTS sugar transporter subunit IIB n=1 Tax=Tigheibacillus halophilus TaxID=361280 RepID=A0ABU5C304_9BACI|nr:PTS sugar transporter subunit IIB [Virgibacillus halophilus]